MTILFINDVHVLSISIFFTLIHGCSEHMVEVAMIYKHYLNNQPHG